MNTQKASGLYASLQQTTRPVVKLEKQTLEASTAWSWTQRFQVWRTLWRPFLQAALRLLVAIATTELKRRVAPGRRSEERYQFESPEMRQGTWGRLY